MPVESPFNYIADLNPSNPVHTDPVAQGDAHIRGLKTVLLTQFPGIVAGGDVAMASSQQQIDATVQLLGQNSGTLTAAIIPIGGVIIWPSATLPNSDSTHWGWCNGGILGNTTVLAALAAACPLLVSGSNVLAPDFRSTFPIGNATMGGASDPARLTSRVPNFSNRSILMSFLGEADHAQDPTELAQHLHAFGTLAGTAAAQTWTYNGSLGVNAGTLTGTLGFGTDGGSTAIGGGRIGLISGSTNVPVSGSPALSGSISGTNSTSAVTMSGSTANSIAPTNRANVTPFSTVINMIIRIL